MARPKLKERMFLAVDGEGITVDGQHRYVMMAASTGESVINPDGLTFPQCAEFLLDLKRSYGDDVIPVSFAFGYDRTMMLAPHLVGHEGAIEFAHKAKSLCMQFGETKYWVSGPMGKWLTIKSHDSVITVNDVFGFFQTSFVKALKSAGIGKDVLEWIAAEKARRASFELADIPDMLRYCLAECELLTELMSWLRSGFTSVQIPVTRWYGPGAVANATLKLNGIKEYHARDTDEMRPMLLRAYFGGRIQTPMLGTFDRVTQYDVNSAYPAITASLPTAHGKWHATTDFLDSQAQWSLWEVDYRKDGDWGSEGYACLPWRKRDGRLLYPSVCKGIYWRPEIEQAIAYGHDVNIIRGWVFEPDTDDKPFAFIHEYYRLRQQLKAEGHIGQHAVKLALNSLYGKFAQSVGKPVWQSYLWAGYITSATRARLLELARPYQDRVVSFATDAIFFTGDVSYNSSSELGGISRTDWTDFLVVQPGVYVGNIDDTQHAKTRSYIAGNIDWERVRDEWNANGTSGIYRDSRQLFYGVGLTSQRRDYDSFGQWKTDSRELLFSTTGFPTEASYALVGRTAKATNGVVKMLHYPAPTDELSHPYRPRGERGQDGPEYERPLQIVQSAMLAVGQSEGG